MLGQLVGEDLKALLERSVTALEKLADAQQHQAFHECPHEDHDCQRECA